MRDHPHREIEPRLFAPISVVSGPHFAFSPDSVRFVYLAYNNHIWYFRTIYGKKAKKESLMSRSNPPIPALDEIRQLNRLFLGFLRERPTVATDRFGLSSRAAGLLTNASPRQIDRAACFPRALFRLCLPPAATSAVMDPLALAHGSGERVLELVLLHSARNLSRMSGYAARLLLRLSDGDVIRLRAAEVDEIVAMSLVEHVVHAAFDQLDWIWQELLTEARPEYRRRLVLIGLQPDFLLRPAAAIA